MNLESFKMTSYFVDKSDCSRHSAFPGVLLQTMTGEQMTLSLVEMEPHAVIEMHSHPHEQIGYMIEGEAEFVVGGETRIVKAGQMWRIPGGVPHRVTAGLAKVRALDAFYPIREDYR